MVSKQQIIEEYERQKRKDFYENLSFCVVGLGFLIMIVSAFLSIPKSGVLADFFNFGYVMMFIAAGIYVFFIRNRRW